MIISENTKPSITEFSSLMEKTDILLNKDAAERESYYIGRNGHLVEKDVFEAVSECAKGTPFQGSIQLVSGASFPDIVAAKYYGVEVKSTKENHWFSIGSSILESTRIRDVERIFLTFGKLGRPVQFLSRPYEDCLSGIAVTHYPRYQIDMRLKKGETIFDKMGISYDELRKMEDPVTPVAKHYKSKLQPGERLWWAGSNIEAATSPVVRLWSTVEPAEKKSIVAQGYALFPELFSGDYNRYSLWLVTSFGIVNTSIRDSFSAGGQIYMKTSEGVEVKMPATFKRIQTYKDQILNTIVNTDEETLKDCWNCTELSADRIRMWCQLAAEASQVDHGLAYSVLCAVFMLS